MYPLSLEMFMIKNSRQKKDGALYLGTRWTHSHQMVSQFAARANIQCLRFRLKCPVLILYCLLKSVCLTLYHGVK